MGNDKVRASKYPIGLFGQGMLLPALPLDIVIENDDEGFHTNRFMSTILGSVTRTLTASDDIDLSACPPKGLHFTAAMEGCHRSTACNDDEA